MLEENEMLRQEICNRDAKIAKFHNKYKETELQLLNVMYRIEHAPFLKRLRYLFSGVLDV